MAGGEREEGESKASAVFAATPQRQHHCLSSISDHQELHSHGSAGPWCQKRLKISALKFISVTTLD